MDIYTIGHSNYSLERLIDMLKYFDINCVVDIRGTPYSKYNVQFDKESIRYSLTKAGFTYIYMAEEFAAKRPSKISYNEEGFSDFEKVVQEEAFKRGVERIKNGINKGYKIVLLGAMQDPIRCHRSILVGRELTKLGFNVKHILDDYTIQNQEYIDNRVLDKYFPDRNQITIDALLGNEMTNEDRINEAYRMANREIGLRVENLQKK
ncbi:DUF488 family protein [Clostridium isatidis]|uniref:DUF488 domain-containing protein n=1 Tax=Clostridium isatidis TaxID=182773 RepID=A0A343JD22_9CLOT|nr:DUF488 domain-containing protein [Clostridium isatidis]ASW43430.1 hypothetical protein BEN51_08045 [Clostridium isatidis]